MSDVRGLVRMPLAARMLVFAVLAGALQAQDAPQTGIFQLSFTERHPLSDYAAMASRESRLSATPDPKVLYDITKEPYDVDVPTEYDGTKPFGLMVHIDAGKTGNPWMYKDLVGPHRLIWIGSTTTDNDRPVVCRTALALDAVWNMSKRYKIDPRRIYLCGLSGGGRCASMTAVAYADVFTGGAIYMVGCNQFQLPDEHKLGIKLLEPAQSHSFVFMTGSKDFNHDGTPGVYNFYTASGFKHCELIDTPDMGHEFPPSAAFGKAIDFLDTQILSEAKEALDAGQELEKKGKWQDAFAAYQSAAQDYPLAEEVASTARPLLEAARAKVDAQLEPEFKRLANATSPSADRLHDFATKWSDFPIAGKARDLADELAGKKLDAIIKSGGAVEPGKLDSFITTWKGYPCMERAVKAYEELAAPAAAPVEAITDPDKRDRARLKFLGKWEYESTVLSMRAALEADLAPQLSAISTLSSVQERGERLQAFAKAWKGTAAGAQAAKLLDALIASMSAPAK